MFDKVFDVVSLIIVNSMVLIFEFLVSLVSLKLCLDVVICLVIDCYEVVGIIYFVEY